VAGLFIQVVIYYSLVTYFLKLKYAGSEHSLEGHPFYLWQVSNTRRARFIGPVSNAGQRIQPTKKLKTWV
jgi:hypothetical protein